MAKTKPYEKFPDKYEEWFKINQYVYLSELQAVKELLPKSENILEISVGNGRFTIPLGINIGVNRIHLQK